ncbi:acyltransferase domain-containing protein [Streptomyces sp. F-1]|uniref:acyltransferase domain-containing protein n=1 Tax=Streptomyces sp. F-1 TaxID=463642 RepID=UPI00086F091E|nr:acyltransferase domain-containing protein [Streptomyces sp. F-1]SFY53586.1 Malonyl CoA-acyl carrier protein transacylase [Streptomyces sp. F-1]
MARIESGSVETPPDPSVRPHWQVHFAVADVEPCARAAEKHGGSVPDTPAAAGTLAQARAALADIGDLPEQLDTAAALASTTNAQLALLISGVANARALLHDYGLQADTVAGHSIGAFSAAVIAGVLSLPEAIRLVHIRGVHMEAACAGGRWSMAALRGLGQSAAQTLLDRLATDTDPLWIANINAPDQLVISGTTTALATLCAHAPDAGATDLVDLNVTVASHCPLQRTTTEAVAAAVTWTQLGEQSRAYLANTSGRRILRDPSKVVQDLAAAVSAPVRWLDAMRLLPELGVTVTVETPPGHVLTRLATQADGNTTALHLATADLGLESTTLRARRAQAR